MKIENMSKEWFEKSAETEGNSEIGAGSPPFGVIPEWMLGSSVEARNALQNCGMVHPYTCDNPDCRATLRAVEEGWVCDECSFTNLTADKKKETKYYIVYESYTDFTQFEGQWNIFVKEFNSLKEAETWIEESEDWKESVQYERIALGPLVKVIQNN